MNLVSESQIIDVTPTATSGRNSGNGPFLANLLEEIADLITHYVSLPKPELSMLIAVWIAQTYCFESFQYCAYLAIQSATPRCGKSKLLGLIRRFVKDTPPISTTPTPANLYRTPHRVILLDEVDKLRSSDKEKFGEVLAILNVGFERGAVIHRQARNTSGNWYQQAFPVFGPKVLAGIETLVDTLADRALFIRMVRTAKRPPRLRFQRLEGRFKTIRDSLDWWVTEHSDDIKQCYDSLPDQVPELSTFDDRLQDLAEPLLVLAFLADAEPKTASPGGTVQAGIWPRLLSGLQEAAKERQPSGREEALVAFLALAHRRLSGQSSCFSPTTTLLWEFEQIEELQWIKTAKTLSNFLRAFDLRPRQSVDGTCRGYDLTKIWVDDWSQRYKT